MRSTSSDRALTVVMIAACPLPLPRGTPLRITRMAEALSARGHQVHVVTYHLGEGEVGGRVQVHRIPPIPLYRKLSPGPSYTKLAVLDPLLAWQVKRVVEAHPPDVIHAHHYEGLLVGLPFRGRAPLVYDAHTLLESEFPHYSLVPGRRIRRSIGRLLDRLLPPRADHVIAVTHGLRDRLIDLTGCDAARISVIGNGVEVAAFRAATGSASGRTLVYAGNLAPYQGIELLLEVVGRLARHDERLRLVLALPPGSAPDAVLQRASAMGIASRLEIVDGGIADLPAALARADVAVHPRPACDGLPMKLLNYMAASLPIVSFRGSSPGLDHGRTAWIVDDDDIDGFAAGVTRLLDDRALARRLGAQARQQVSRTASWALAASEVDEVYHQVIADRTARPR